MCKANTLPSLVLPSLLQGQVRRPELGGRPRKHLQLGGGVAEKQGQVNIRTLFCTPLYPFLGHSHPREGGPQTWGLSSADVPKRSLERSSQSCPAKKRGDTGSSFLQSVPEVFEDSHQDRISFPSLFSRALLPHHRRVIAVEMGHRPRIVVLGALQFIHWQLSYGSQPHCLPSLAPQKPLPQRKLFKTGLSRLYLEPMEPEAQACNLPLQPCTPLASEEYGFLVLFSSHKAQCQGPSWLCLFSGVTELCSEHCVRSLPCSHSGPTSYFLWGQSHNPMGRAFALYVDIMGSIPGTPYGPQTQPGVIQEHRGSSSQP